jgi:dTDP-glucose 4,6-dehydratase
MSTRILITGGAGFIGSALTRHLIENSDCKVLVYDKLTYAGNLSSLSPVSSSDHFSFLRADICDRVSVSRALADFEPDVVMHLAAESHVDRSIDGPAAFVETNLVGTFTMLDCALNYWRQQSGQKARDFRFIHISTDEVFGSLGESGAFTEETPYDPSSPYSATKAASDHLVRAWHRTFGMPVTISNCSNNYGPRQHPEKLMPLMILNARAGKALPVYGKGANIRDWLHVEDHCAAIELILDKGVPGRTYNVGGHGERTNMQVVDAICQAVAGETGKTVESVREQIRYVQDRPGHDFRYAIDPRRIESELGWKPRWSFEEGLRETVRWYLANEAWCESAVNDEYRRWTQTQYGATPGTNS